MHMRNEMMGVVLLFILSVYSATSVSWYAPSASMPAVVFGVFPVMGALGVIYLAFKRGTV